MEARYLIELEIYKTQKEGMIIANKCRDLPSEAPAYDEDAFLELSRSIELLHERCVRGL